MSELQTLALGVQYDGRAYSGWQVQTSPPLPTVQGELQKALSFIANEAIQVICAGRTDRGVHASHQVVSFRTTAERPDKAWIQGVNTRLPKSISVAWVKVVPEEFHARFSATARRYHYFMLDRPARSALIDGRITWQPRILDANLMHQAAQALLGENDFSAFRGAGCQGNTPFRYMSDISVERMGDLIRIDVCANAFLLHMVRNIVGSLIEVGTGEKPVTWMAELLAQKDRTKAGVTAPPDGLYLVDVTYPQQFGLPEAETPTVLF